MTFSAQLSRFNTGSLDLLQRILLVTDGTLTDTIAAAFSEEIGLRKLELETRPACCRIESLDLNEGQLVMKRKVLLVGQSTGKTYVYAESLLAVDRLSPQFRQGLIVTNTPLGRLWSEHRLETWKELLQVDRVQMGELACHFQPTNRCDLLTRTYRLISGGRPIMLITECFPTVY